MKDIDIEISSIKNTFFIQQEITEHRETGIKLDDDWNVRIQIRVSNHSAFCCLVFVPRLCVLVQDSYGMFSMVQLHLLPSKDDLHQYYHLWQGRTCVLRGIKVVQRVTRERWDPHTPLYPSLWAWIAFRLNFSSQLWVNFNLWPIPIYDVEVLWKESWKIILSRSLSIWDNSPGQMLLIDRFRYEILVSLIEPVSLKLNYHTWF